MGSLAPDAVHFRENYLSDMKKRSHLCIGSEAWGSVTNNSEWQENVLSFFNTSRNEHNFDFICGYCSHILADIQNNINIWIPFKIANNDFLESGAGEEYKQELLNLDYKLYLTNPYRKVIWDLLVNAAGYNIKDIIFADEIDRMKDSLINSQFKNRDNVDTSNNKFVSLQRIQKFIASAADSIQNLLFSNVQPQIF
ncbi:MAG TPA: hypothetical protein VHT96_09295 [Clostridia bacterium]|nr:hypothetical protein [Clostridia bacterium]